MPQRMEVPQRSEAGGDGDPHQQQYDNEEFYEADGDDADGVGEGASGSRQERDAGFGAQVEQCGCQGLDGQHRCEAAAAEDGTVNCASWGVPQEKAHSLLRVTGSAPVPQKNALAAYVDASALGASAGRGCMQRQTETCCREIGGSMLTGMLASTDTPNSQGHTSVR